MTGFKKVFVDTAPIIYYLENNPLYREAVKKFFIKCLKENIKIITSALTVEEYLVFPFSCGKTEYMDNFKRFITYMGIEVVNIDPQIAEQGAKIRSEYKAFKAMDALQLATAIITGCDMFFTNDKQLRQEKELPCMTMDDLQ